MPNLVVLDIETTGLDPKRDSILEIGAVRFNGRRVEAEWSTLVNPGRAVPPFISQLTGITNQMVAGAPPISEVAAELADFVGDLRIVGHNVSFDLAFLRRLRLFNYNDAIDTYEMASVLLPKASRYGLASLASLLAVPLRATHRALEDSLVTHGVYLRLHELAVDLPIELLAEIVRMGEQAEWNGYWGFRLALEERAKEVVRARKVADVHAGPLFGDAPIGEGSPPLSPNQEFIPLDSDEVAAIFEYGGAFSQHFSEYEFRPQQVEMVRAVTQALSKARHLLVEASTGVGKSFAYLIPAALWAKQNNARVVISTNTINLQDQLIHKDIPDLRDSLDLDFQVSVLKGRGNYLCPRRLDNFRHRGPESGEEVRILGKILVWLLDSNSGDRAELNLNGTSERDIWLRISADDEACTQETCLQRTGGACPFYRARLAAHSAHIVIVNHALLLADVATGNRVLPEYDYLIVDEAHHLEEASTNALSYQVTHFEVVRMLRELGSSTVGSLGWALRSLENLLSPTDFAAFNKMVSQTTDKAFQFEQLSQQFFTGLDQFLLEQREGHPVGQYPHQERILPASRSQPAWDEVEAHWDRTQIVLGTLVENLEIIAKVLSEKLDVLSEEDQEVFNQISSLYRRFGELQDHLNGFVFEPQVDRIYWVEVKPDGRMPSLHEAPLHIGPLMERYLWHEKSSVILTSATLTAAGEFDYLRDRLQAMDAYELMVGSPFDYENATLLYLANDIPEPNQRQAYQRGINQSLVHLCRKTGGRTLVLFTSYAQLRATSQAISPPLAEDGILVYEQGEGASSHTLLESFRSADKAVLLGTRAFWEGVDVPGEALSVLVIAKLPFDVPSDPIIASRAETFEDPFFQFSLPEAILRFRQGFGRLIRTQSDRGVVAILDRRVLSKRYGKIFIESLPPCTTRVGPLGDLPRAAEHWLNL
ncbi:MAG: DEAD/DEAH box helicase family protein [Chloroflexota bacterium]|nr:MAG: DEAD/DEAH box helicase family protein [Chloroflexota bacterium]